MRSLPAVTSAACFLLSSCTTSHQEELIVSDRPRGAAHLQRVDDAQASSSEEIRAIRQRLMHKAAERHTVSEEVRMLQRHLDDLPSRIPSTRPRDSGAFETHPSAP